MSDPFATALGVLMQAPGTESATYLPQAGGSYTTQVIRARKSADNLHGFAGTLRDGDQITIPLAAIPEPVTGDTITIGAETLHVLAAATLDVEGLSWIIQAAPDPV